LLIESLALALAGGAGSFGFAFVALEWMRRQGIRSVPRLHEIGIDAGMFAVTLALSVASGVLCGLLPALRLCRIEPQGDLRPSGHGLSSGGAFWSRSVNTRRLLVVAELALSVVLLIGAGLLIRSFAKLRDVPPGFNPSGTLTIELTMNGRRYVDDTDGRI